jgi:hypothetical protein
VNDEKAGEVIQLQGDQRNAIKDFLVDKEKGLDIDAKTIKVRSLQSVYRSLWTNCYSFAGPWLLSAKCYAPPATPARGKHPTLAENSHSPSRRDGPGYAGTMRARREHAHGLLPSGGRITTGIQSACL